jgi:hypothetical protein
MNVNDCLLIIFHSMTVDDDHWSLLIYQWIDNECWLMSDIDQWLPMATDGDIELMITMIDNDR